MTRSTATIEEGGEELKRLYREYMNAGRRAEAALRKKGMKSPEFAEADKAAGQKLRRIREILGDADKHRMSS